MEPVHLSREQMDARVMLNRDRALNCLTNTSQQRVSNCTRCTALTPQPTFRVIEMSTTPRLRS